MKHKANPDDFDNTAELNRSIEEERRRVMKHAQQQEDAKYRRDMRLVNSVMIFCAVAFVVLLVLQID